MMSVPRRSQIQYVQAAPPAQQTAPQQARAGAAHGGAADARFRAAAGTSC